MAQGTCVGPECDRPIRYATAQLCGAHYQQVYLRGVELTPIRRYRAVTDGKKECRLCGFIKPVEEFWMQSGTKRQSACIECSSILHGLGFDEVKALLERPCDACGVEISGSKAFIDHCHDSGRVRGVLCIPCNTILMEHVTPELLRKLADYLERSHADRA